MARVLPSVLLALLVFVATGEALCRWLPVSTATEVDYYLDPQIRTYPPGHRWATATGWDLRRAQAMVANNLGFAAEHDFVPDETAVALIGDSYVEASMLPMAQRLAHQLEQALGGARRVYAMGSPGTSLLDYGERIRWAHEHMGVRDFVLLVEAGDVAQSLCGSGNIDGPCLDGQSLALRHEHYPAASRLKQWGRHSALAQYLFSQLKADGARLWHQARQQSMPGQGHDVGARVGVPALVQASSSVDELRRVDAVAAEFFSGAAAHVRGKLVLIVDGDRGGPRSFRVWKHDQRERFIASAQAAGAVVLDIEPVFKAHYARSNLSLDVAPTDAHLNALGLGLLAPPAAVALGSH